MSARAAELENRDRLRDCVRPHAFRLVGGDGQGSRRATYRCLRCGGEINAQAHGWYSRGLADGFTTVRREAAAP